MNEIKSMIETFSIKEEKFINKTYNLNLGVSFNKKKIFKLFRIKRYISFSNSKKKFLFIPIIIDQSKTDIMVFSIIKYIKIGKKLIKKNI